MEIQLLLLLLFSVPNEACLRVQDVTPKCACKVQGIDYSSVSDYTNDAALIQNVTLYDIEPPSIILDDCSVSVQCPDQYSLIVLDTDSYRMFGEYSADGFCDPTTQTWLVADDAGFSSFNQMNGFCVGYNFRCDCKIDDILVRDPGVKFQFFVADVKCVRDYYVSCSRSDDLKCQTVKYWVENENGKYEVGISSWNLLMVSVTCGDDGRWMENGQGIQKLTKLYCTFENCV
ncbi:unnamed protein product [Caenorhabditis brenneri]